MASKQVNSRFDLVNNRVFKDGHIFNRRGPRRTSRGIVKYYAYCPHKTCKVSLVSLDNKTWEYVDKNKVHAEITNEENDVILQFRNEAVQQMKIPFTTAAVAHKRALEDESFKHHQDVLALETKRKMNSSLKRCKKTFNIGVINDLNHLGQKFSDSPIRHKLTTFTTAVLEMGPDRDPIIAIFNAKLVFEINKTIDLVNVKGLADGTYSCVPRSLFRNPKCKSNQLFNVMILYNGRYINIMSFLMPQKKIEYYEKSFDFVHKTYTRLVLSPLMHDFESAIGSGAKKVNSNIELDNCYFHYTQCLDKRYLISDKIKKPAKEVAEIGESENDILLEKVNTNCKKMLKYLKVLPLLPTTDIPVGFTQIMQSTIMSQELDGKKHIPIVKTLMEKLQSFESYYKKEWYNEFIKGRYSWHRMDQSTDNPLESYHRLLNDNCVKNPDGATFVESQIKIQNSHATILEQAVANHEILKGSVHYERRRETLNKLWDELDKPHGALEIASFIRRAASIQKGYEKYYPQSVLDINLQEPTEKEHSNSDIHCSNEQEHGNDEFENIEFLEDEYFLQHKEEFLMHPN